MQDSFISEFISKIEPYFSQDDLLLIGKQLKNHTMNYDVCTKETHLTCDDQLTKYMQMYMVTRKIEGISPNSLKLYHYYLADFVRQTRKRVYDLTPNDIRLFLYGTQKSRGISSRTLESRRVIVTAFMRWLYDEGYTKENAAKGIKPIRFQVNPTNALTSVEMEKIRNACKDKRETAIIETLYSTGCRVTELITLKYDDINLNDREVMVFGKGGKTRTSYLNAKAEVSLYEYWNTRTDNNTYAFVSLNKPHKELTKECVEKIVRNIGKRAGIKRRVYPHLIRHTVATDLLSRGMNIAEIQRFLGHKNIDTTMIYARVCDGDIKNNHKKYI